MEAPLSTWLIQSGTVVCMDRAGTIVSGDVLIERGVITAIGADATARAARLPAGEPAGVIDARGGWVLPGLVQGHLHLCQTLFRGRAEQGDLLRWLREAIWPFEAAHTPDSIAASARLGVLELLAGGVTCVNDMGTVHHGDAIAAALEQSGIRAVFGKALMDRGDGVPRGLSETADQALASALALADRWDGAGDGRIRVSLAPRFILSCSEPLWRGVRDASRARGMIVHTHLAESPGEALEVQAVVGDTAARYFATHELLSQRFVGAHGIWLDTEELGMLAQARAALVHCPGSNLKLGSGLANVRAWLDAGVRCGLGSDGAACNNRLDTFHELSLAAGVSRVTHAAAPLTAREALSLATLDGAAALGWDAAIGSLEPGKQADVIVLDARGAHVAPVDPADPYTAIVHAARATDVLLTMVAGRVLYRDGAWTTLDPELVVRDAEHQSQALQRRVERA